jgi:hypothetical protein
MAGIIMKVIMFTFVLPTTFFLIKQDYHVKNLIKYQYQISLTTLLNFLKKYTIKGKKIELSLYCNQCGMEESLFLKPENQICRKLGLDKIAAEAKDDRNTIVNLTLMSDDEFIDAVKKGTINFDIKDGEAKGQLADISIIDCNFDSYKKDNIQIGRIRHFKEAGNVSIHSIVMSLFAAIMNGDLGAKDTFRKFAEKLLLRTPK